MSYIVHITLISDYKYISDKNLKLQLHGSYKNNLHCNIRELPTELLLDDILEIRVLLL